MMEEYFGAIIKWISAEEGGRKVLPRQRPYEWEKVAEILVTKKIMGENRIKK